MGPNLSEDVFFCSSPNFAQKLLGPHLSEDLVFWFVFVPHLILGAQHQSLYPEEKFLSEALTILGRPTGFGLIKSPWSGL